MSRFICLTKALDCLLIRFVNVYLADSLYFVKRSRNVSRLDNQPAQPMLANAATRRAAVAVKFETWQHGLAWAVRADCGIFEPGNVMTALAYNPQKTKRIQLNAVKNASKARQY